MPCGGGRVRLAILVDFQKVREGTQEVEYRFGFPEMNRRLVIRKDSHEGKPLDGNENLLYRKAFGQIIRYRVSERTWPERGSYAA